MPSLEEVIPDQVSIIPPGLRSVQLAPEVLDVQMFPLYTTAASLVPSLEEVMPYQLRALSLEVQLAPESVDVQIFPPSSTAASLVPSLEDVMPIQSFVLPTEVSSVQVAAAMTLSVRASRTLNTLRRSIVKRNVTSFDLKNLTDHELNQGMRVSRVTRHTLETLAEPTTTCGSRR